MGDIKDKIIAKCTAYYQDKKGAYKGKSDKELEAIFKKDCWEVTLQRYSKELTAPKIDKDPSREILAIVNHEYKGDNAELNILY